jgi:hypothetical protein
MTPVKIIHFISILFLFLGLGLLISHRVIENAGITTQKGLRKLGSILHGIGLLGLIGTGLHLATYFKVGVEPNQSYPTWFWIKIGLWLCFGALFSLFKRSKLGVGALITIVLALGCLTVYVASVKPFG